MSVSTDFRTEMGEILRNSLSHNLARINQLQAKFNAIETKIGNLPPEVKSLGDTLRENQSVAKLMKEKKGQAIFTLSGAEANALLSQKTAVTSAAVGLSTTGVLTIDRIPGIVPEARQALTIRDLLYSRPTTGQLVDFVKVNSPMSAASPQLEADYILENAVGFTSASERVKTIASWLPASAQILDDLDALSSFLQTSLVYQINRTEEVQLLSGSGAGENLTGFITAATAFNTGLLSNSWNNIDIVGRAVQQVTMASEVPPTFVILNPKNWWNMRLTKDAYGRYILGDPQTVTNPTLFGLDVVPTTNIAADTFLLGNGTGVCQEIVDRQEITVEISTSHSDFFTKNMVAIKAFKRLAHVIKRPGAYIYGSFTSSPA
ncbi:MAG TPA: phage major capsid protein [Bryobacteraceae bacterium]|jgi:HK97 family phage major capsid protein|nr:phage major capsid protein [Bryobacteraceae bacterium]